MSTTPLRAVAFDLDGTLIDSRADLAAAVNGACADLGLRELALDEIVGMVGEGARNLVRRALGGAPAEELLDRALERFYLRYDDECTRRTRPFPGIDAALTALVGVVPLALVTNKPERFTRRIVDHLGWTGRFDPLIGGDSLPTRKPDPQGLNVVVRRHGGDPRAVALVGDSRIDERTAAAAGCSFVFARWGFAREEERRELDGLPAADDAPALLDLLRPQLPRATSP